jgi:hypothetical protein
MAAFEKLDDLFIAQAAGRLAHYFKPEGGEAATVYRRGRSGLLRTRCKAQSGLSVMSPRAIGFSTTYKTRAALEKPCKQHSGIVIGQGKNSHDLKRKFSKRILSRPAFRRAARKTTTVAKEKVQRT